MNERRRNFDSNAHRIAMIDWCGFATACMFCIGVLAIGVIGGSVLAKALLS